MQSIIVSGGQGVGKSHFAREIAKRFISQEISITTPLSRLNPLADVVIIDDLTIKDLPAFKELISREVISFRPPYEKLNVSIKPIIIGVFQEHLPEFDEARHSVVFHIKK